jgi:ubiquinone/menaquinone biosynthesis C-methylase UbiE
MCPIEKLLLNIERTRLIKKVKGNVLELGVGTGVNLKYYNFKNIKKLTLLDLSVHDELYKKKTSKIDIIEGDAKRLSFESNTFDYIVQTLVLCSVDKPNISLDEIKRVLKKDGTLIFIEHVLSHYKSISNLQNKVNIIWPKIASGCNLNRDTEDLLKKQGFIISQNKSFFKGIFISGIANK